MPGPHPSCGDSEDKRNTRLLEIRQCRQCHARIHEPNTDIDELFFSEFLGDRRSAVIIGAIIALDQQEFPTEDAASFVDLSCGQFDPLQHADAHWGGSTGERTNDAYADRLPPPPRRAPPRPRTDHQEATSRPPPPP